MLYGHKKTALFGGLLPGTGLEPASLAALAPQASASANFATRADHSMIADKCRQPQARGARRGAKVPTCQAPPTCDWSSDAGAGTILSATNHPALCRGIIMPAPLTPHAPVGSWTSLAFGSFGRGAAIQIESLDAAPECGSVSRRAPRRRRWGRFGGGPWNRRCPRFRRRSRRLSRPALPHARRRHTHPHPLHR